MDEQWHFDCHLHAVACKVDAKRWLWNLWRHLLCWQVHLQGNIKPGGAVAVAMCFAGAVNELSDRSMLVELCSTMEAGRLLQLLQLR